MSSRKNFKNTSESAFTLSDNSRRTGIVFFIISVLVHCLFFAAIIFFQDFRLPKPLPPVIQVDLVSFAPEPALEEPAEDKAPLKKEGVSVKTPVIKKKPHKIPTLKPDISLKTKPKNLKELMDIEKKKKKKLEKKKIKKPVKKNLPKEDKDLKNEKQDAAKKREKKAEDLTKDRIARALSRLQKKVEDQGSLKKGDKKGVSAGYGKKGYKPIDLYKMVLGAAIEQNWVFNDVFAHMDQNLEVRILIKILKSGQIRDIIYETRSGNRYLDESAKKAIKKTNPLPQLPPGMHSYDVLVIFTPKGLK